MQFHLAPGEGPLLNITAVNIRNVLLTDNKFPVGINRAQAHWIKSFPYSRYRLPASSERLSVLPNLRARAKSGANARLN